MKHGDSNPEIKHGDNNREVVIPMHHFEQLKPWFVKLLCKKLCIKLCEGQNPGYMTLIFKLEDNVRKWKDGRIRVIIPGRGKDIFLSRSQVSSINW